MCASSKRSKRVGKKLRLQKSNAHMTLMHALKYGTHKWPKLGTHKSKISGQYPFYHHHPPPDSSLTFESKQIEQNNWPMYISSILWLGPASRGTRTMAVDPTFGSFTLLKPVSHELNWFLWWKCLDCLDRNGFFLVFRVWTK
jgi:hypothetical protein